MSSTRKRPLPIIRVFVSSTFSDLKHERNALHAKVWPELERYCQHRGFTFQAIDLRWGVPAEAGLDHRTMRICFEELRRSQETSPEPNFLILLGNRYGWRPLPEEVSVDAFQQLRAVLEPRPSGSGLFKDLLPLPDGRGSISLQVFRVSFQRDDDNVRPICISTSSNHACATLERVLRHGQRA